MKRIRLPRWMFGLYFCLAAFLVPWIIYLSFTLPQRHIVRHWDAAWVGFDIILLVVVTVAAWLAYQHSEWVILAASAAAALLLADAWFDAVTARPGNDLALSVAMAFVLEIPLAILSLAVAGSTLSRITSALKK